MNRRDLLKGVGGIAAGMVLAPVVPMTALVQPAPLNPFLFTANLESHQVRIVPGGLSIEEYLRNPVILWNHDPQQPIGISKRVSIGKFAQQGIAADIEIRKNFELYREMARLGCLDLSWCIQFEGALTEPHGITTITESRLVDLSLRPRGIDAIAYPIQRKQA
jgi:hypothetical protein